MPYLRKKPNLYLFKNATMALLTACQAPVALASPTADEFLPCHQIASSALLKCFKCLDQSHGYNSGKCWDSARALNEACYAKVSESHRPDAARIEAAKQTAGKQRQGKGAQ